MAAATLRPVARFAWALVVYDVAVVGWGAYVRATGAGAGCGRHWPTCTGDLIPRSPAVATLVELSHRVSSAIAFLMTAAVLVWTILEFPRRHPARRAAAVATGLMVGEALIGAGLVLFSLVARDVSLKRALSICLHLINTFFLLAATALTAWWASGAPPVRLRNRPATATLLGVPLAAMIAVGASGAVTALGDTLFPAPSLGVGLARDFAPGAHFLVRLRVLHPVIALLATAVVVACATLTRRLRPGGAVQVLSRGAAMLVVLQTAAGLVDLTLSAPVAMQLVHVVLADVAWIVLVLTAAAALADDSLTSEAYAPLRPPPQCAQDPRDRPAPWGGWAGEE
ncbi:MAG TPA: COX15/CtaA family protein [Polyangiaceae bacterium]|nr:COX15/CtaA family protein [Polyangiaceae bacterium]